MEENLILLGVKIKKDPTTYKSEYLTQLKTFNALINLPSPPIKQIKPMVFFLVKHCHLELPNTLNSLLNALENVKDYKTKKLILRGLIILRQKKFIESKELVRLVLLHGEELRSFLKNIQEFLDVECYEVLVEWYKKGTERQKCFCYFLLLVLFSKIHDTADRKKMERECNQIKANCYEEYVSSEEECQSESSVLMGENILEDEEFEDSEESFKKRSAKSLVRDDIRFDNSLNKVNLKELEEIICSAFSGISRITKMCCLYFLNRTEVKFDITKLQNGKSTGKKIYKELSEEVIDREIKLMKLKIFILFKEHFNVKKSVVKIILNMIDLEKEDLKDLLDCIVASVDKNEIKDVLNIISDTFLRDNTTDEIVVYGLNVMRSIYSRFNNVIDLEEDEDESSKFINEIKELILKHIEHLQGNRTKSIFFAYKMIIKVLIKGEEVEMPITHLKKKSTRDEREIIRKKGREEIRRLREEAKREEKHELFKKKTKGRKKTTMLKFMLKPNAKKTKNKKRR